MRAWFIRIVTFAGLVGTVTGLPWYMTLIWTDSYRAWFETHAMPILFGSGVVSLLTAFMFDRFAANERASATRDRMLTEEQTEALGDALSEWKQTRIIVTWSTGQIEPGQFAGCLMHALGRASWHCNPFPLVRKRITDVVGVRIEVSATATSRERLAARALRTWLDENKFDVEPVSEMPKHEEYPGILPTHRFEAPISVTVGVRR